MIYNNIPISVPFEADGQQYTAKATLSTYIIQDEGYMLEYGLHPAILICPGGGYGNVSSREGDPIARRFSAAGYQAFVLDYEVMTTPFPSHLLTAAKAVAFIRENAKEWHINPEKVFVIGFSAGGHLAASLGTLWNRSFVKDTLGYHNQEHRPTGMILSYPVITSGEFAHHDSFRNLLLHRYSDSSLQQTSLEKQVSKETVPTFIWHTYEDKTVPVENALLFATALRQQGIPLEMHIFPYGPHGLSLATPEVGCIEGEYTVWPDLAIRWAKNLK